MSSSLVSSSVIVGFNLTLLEYYSQRIWGNTQKLADNLKEDLLAGVLSGKSGRKIAEDIAKRYNVSIYNAERLVRTETNYIANQAEIESYKESGIEKYRFVATLDSRTSEICQQLDGQEFPVSDAQAGVNLPPMHAHCRSTTISVISEKCLENLERRAKNPDGTISKVPADMSYKEWKKSLTEHEKSGIIKSEEVKVLEQAKKRDHKIYITDIAIDKITNSKIKYLTDEQNKYIDSVHKKLLIKSQKENNSNEVAYLFDLIALENNEDIFEFGSENSVNIFSNPLAVAKSRRRDNLFFAHNHPSTMNFSYSDLGVFLLNDCFKGISVVSNTGDVHILYKTDKYNFNLAFKFIRAERSKYEFYNADIDKKIVDMFLKNSYKFGIVQF